MRRCKKGHYYDEKTYGQSCPFCTLYSKKGVEKKTCSKGHIYDFTIYGDNCPFCLKRNKPKVFGTTINETAKVFKSIGSSEKSQKVSTKERNVILFRTIASLVLASVAVYFFTCGKHDVSFGLGGSIIGYWLK